MTGEDSESEEGLGPDGGSWHGPPARRALVVGHSHVTRVVVARIVERAGLRTMSLSPDEALTALAEFRPDAVVLDGGADNRQCDALLAGLVLLRRQGGRALPAVILLSNRIQPAALAAHEGVVDAVVAKPITPEQLQPVVERLLAGGPNPALI